MAAPPNVELEAAKFLHKLIQDSKDEPTKLATKLYVILQHMRSSGKENSMPYQVISRAMETVINQHGLDIDALMSSRLPLTSGTQVGDSTSSQYGGSSRAAVPQDANAGMASNEMSKIDHFASNRPPIGPNSAGHDIYQGSVPHLNSKSLDHESPSSFDTRPVNSQSEEMRDSPNWEKANEKDSKKGNSKRKRASQSLASERLVSNLNSGMDTVVNKIEQSRSLSNQGVEHGHFNMVRSSNQMEHGVPLTAGMRSLLRSKQEIQHQTENSLDSTNFSNSLSRGPPSRHPEEIEVSSAHNALGLQQGGSLPSTHDIRGLWNQNKVGLPFEKSQVQRFSFHTAGGNLSAETLVHQSAASSLGSSASGKIYGATPGASGLYTAAESGIPSVAQYSSSYDSHGLGPKVHKDRSMETFSSTVSVELPSVKGTVGKSLDNEGGLSNTSGIATNTVQGGMLNNITEMTMLRSTGKSPIFDASAASCMPFKEQHLKQLRAQCLVFLAFRNGLMPKKLHLDIALGNFFPKEDGPSKEMIDQKGKEQSIDDPNSTPDVTIQFGRLDNAKEAERSGLGPSSSGMFADAKLVNQVDNMNMVGDKNDTSSGRLEYGEERGHLLVTTRNVESEMQTPEIAKSHIPATKGAQPDGLGLRGLENRHRQVGLADQAYSAIGSQMKPEVTGWRGNGCHDEASRVLLPSSAVTEPFVERKDNPLNQSPNLGGRSVQINQHAELPSFPLRERWKPLTRMDGGIHLASEEVDTDLEEEDISISTDIPSSPKYTTSEKWIMDQQKRKHHTEQTWALKQQRTEQRITACSDKLKETVSSSEDISAKTRSVIELKKLQLLQLQRRLRNDILNDYFKPIATDMDRLKLIKKHRIGRRSKQLERFEQKMKEERQKRFRERQKEFFSEIEIHRERLEDVFKMRRERWKGFNKYVREFHKRKERVYREKIDRIQREKINLLKINDVEGYLRMVQDAKSDRVKQLLKETEKYLQKLGSKLRDAKAMGRCFDTGMDESRHGGAIENTEITFDNEDETDQAKHYLESNEKYYLMAHSIKENVAEQPTCLEGGKLREYQMNGLRWLVSLYNNHLNGILADEMGLGKTVQVIALICYLMETKNDRGPFLVVVPSSVLSGWASEINFWAPSINKIVYSGPPEERRKLFKERIVHQKFNVLLTTYEYLMNKHDRPKLSKIHWHYVIIDEGHRIKNASCKLNADLKHYRSSHRLLLTGTPLQNNLEELWALLNFLLPNIFNSSEDFSQWFNKPFESNGDNSPDNALLSEEENLLIINRLHQVLRPFVLRRLKHKVENELPEKIERLVRCEASAYQKLLMKRVEENLGAFGNSKARSVHNSVMELRNICNHPYLSQLHVEEVHDLIPTHYLPNIVRLCGKLEMLDRLLPKLKATDHRVLLFSTMTRLLDVMEDYLYWKQYRYLRLDGHTSGGDRGALIDQFNQSDSPYFIFLLSIRAGGVGVNLQAADTVIIFDTDWNPQVDLQAQARAHRIGQKRDVLVLRLETVQTVEEQVRAAAEHKLGVANQSITAGFFDNNTSAEDRREYLESLLRECKKEEAAPVLDDDALNDLIARSESEIDVFESVDKRRQDEEMAAWKKLVLGPGINGSEPVCPLPSRLLTEDELKPFCEAMKVSDIPSPVVVSNIGVKRKSEYLGGLDTQHYGRGKRAREVRSYEEQWTEDEFEKLCQVESPQSPKLVEEVKVTNLPVVPSESSEVTAETETMIPSKQPTQPSLEQPTQQAKEVTPPSKRGRGRPKRTKTEISPSPIINLAPSAAGNIDQGSQRGTVSCNTVAHGPDSLPGCTTVRSISGIHQFGVWIAPSSQSTATLPSASPGTQSIATLSSASHGTLSTTTLPSASPGTQFITMLPSVSPGTQPATIPCPSMPLPGKRRGRKAQSEVAPRRRGRKQSVSSVTPVLSPSTGADFTTGLQGGVITNLPVASGPETVSGPIAAKDVSKDSDSLFLLPVPIPSSGTSKSIESQGLPISSSPMFPTSSIVTGTGGTVHDHVVAAAPGSLKTLPLLHVSLESQPISIDAGHTSRPNPPLHSVALGSQSAPAKLGKGRGRKAQSGVEAPRRRGRKPDAVYTVVSDSSGSQEPTPNEPPEKKSIVSVERNVITTRSKQQNEAQKSTIPAKEFQVQTSYRLASLDKQETSSSVTTDAANRSPDKKSVNVKIIGVDAPVSSEDGILSTEIEVRPSSADRATGQILNAGVKYVPLRKEAKSDTRTSVTEVRQSSINEGGEALTLAYSRPSVLEVSVNQSSDNETYAELPTTGSAAVGDLPMGNTGTHSGKKGAEKVEEMLKAPLEEYVTPNPEINESESERSTIFLVASTTTHEILQHGNESSLDEPTTTKTLAEFTGDQCVEEREGSAMLTSETMCVTQNLDNNSISALFTSGTDPVCELSIEKLESPTRKEGVEKVEDVIKPLTDGGASPTPKVHQSGDKINAAAFVLNISNQDQLNVESLRSGFGSETTDIHLSEKSLEAKASVVSITMSVESYAGVNLVVKDCVKDCATREKAEAEIKMEDKKLSESKGDSGCMETTEEKQDPATAVDSMVIGEAKVSEEVKDTVHALTEQERMERNGMTVLNDNGETDTTEEKHDVAADESMQPSDGYKDCRREQQGGGALHAVGEMVVETVQTVKVVLAGHGQNQDQTKEGICTGIPEEYSMEGESNPEGTRQIEIGGSEIIEEKNQPFAASTIEGSNTKLFEVEKLFQGENGNVRSLAGPTATETLPEGTENQNLEERKSSALSTLETLSVTEILCNKTYSTLPTLGTDTVRNHPMGKFESSSGMQGIEKMEEIMESLSDGSVSPMPKVCEPEDKINATDYVQKIVDPETLSEESLTTSGFCEITNHQVGLKSLRAMTEYTSEKSVGMTNAVVDAVDVAGIVGEELMGMKDVALSSGNSSTVYLGEKLNAVAAAEERAENYAAVEEAEAVKEMEAENISDSKGESGFLETIEEKQDFAAAESTMEVVEAKFSEVNEESFNLVTEHDRKELERVGELHDVGEIGIENQQPMDLVGLRKSQEEDKHLGSEEYSKQGEFKSEVEVLGPETSEKKHDLGEGECITKEIQSKPSAEAEEFFKGATEVNEGGCTGRTEEYRQQGEFKLEAVKVGSEISEVKHDQAEKENIMGREVIHSEEVEGVLKEANKIKESGCTTISEDYKKHGEFKPEVEIGCPDTMEEKNDFAAEVSAAKRGTESSEREKGISSKAIEHGRRELQGGGALHTPGGMALEIRQTVKGFLSGQDLSQEGGYTSIPEEFSKQGEFKLEVEIGVPEIMEEKHNLLQTGTVSSELFVEESLSQASKVKSSENFEVCQGNDIPDISKELEVRILDASAESRIDVGQTYAECPAQQCEAEGSKPSENVQIFQETRKNENTEQLGGGVLQAIEETTFEIEQKTEDPIGLSHIRANEEVKSSEEVAVSQKAAEREKNDAQSPTRANEELKPSEEVAISQKVAEHENTVSQFPTQANEEVKPSEEVAFSQKVTEDEKSVPQCQIERKEAEKPDKIEDSPQEGSENEGREQQTGGEASAEIGTEYEGREQQAGGETVAEIETVTESLLNTDQAQVMDVAEAKHETGEEGQAGAGAEEQDNSEAIVIVSRVSSSG